MFTYRPVVRANAGPYKGAALVGTHSVSIGWSFEDPALRDGLLGFAIRRSEFSMTGELLELKWLGGYKRFAESDPGAAEVTSLTAPFQRFRWNQYDLHPEFGYRYEVFPMRGTPTALTRDESPLVFEFRPTPEDDGTLGIYVNRGVTAAKAYFDRFGDARPRDTVQPAATFAWLSRGLKESLLDFINQTQTGQSLHVAIYEFFEPEIVGAFKAALDRGVTLSIVHDAKPGKKSTTENLHAIHHFGLDNVAIARNTVNISHNKLVIRLDGTTPVAAWTGSANFSENAFYYQTNTALVVRDAAACQHFEDYFQNLTGNPTKAASKLFNRALMTAANAQTPRWANTSFFSPVSQLDIVDAAVDMISNASDIVMISAPFGVHRDMETALKADMAARVQYGLANSTAGAKIADLRNRSTRFFPPKKLKFYDGDRWDAKAFGAHKIHAKTIVTDPFGDNPKVLIGSANFSKPSCKDNDENTQLIEGDKRLAAIIGTEFMRMYDHYKARWWIEELQGVAPNLHLKSDTSWSNTAYNPNANSHKFRDRLSFAG